MLCSSVERMEALEAEVGDSVALRPWAGCFISLMLNYLTFKIV